jgi:uncharacterized membrane protein
MFIGCIAVSVDRASILASALIIILLSASPFESITAFPVFPGFSPGALGSQYGKEFHLGNPISNNVLISHGVAMSVGIEQPLLM